MPIISNSVQNNGGSSSSVTPRSRTYRSGGTSVRLQEGQTLKGVVSDVHGNQITLSMEDGSSFTGKLPDANQYSIGQKAAFQIVSLSDNTIYLKAVTGAYLLDMEDTIEQALEEASLPKTERNLDVVRSLLLNRQSISRESILSSIQLCAQYPEADVNAVITMNRLHLPLTKESVAQFENYLNQNHSLLTRMDSLTDSIGEMLKTIGSNVPRLAQDVGAKILSIALDGAPSPEELALPENRLVNTTGQGDTSLPVLYDAEGNVVTAEALTEGTVTAVFDENGNPVSEEQWKTYLQTSAEAEEPASTTEAAGPAEKEASPNPLARMRQIFSNLSDSNSAIRSAVARSEITNDFRTPFIHEQTGFLLAPSERQAFSLSLSEYPLPESIKNAVADGTATAREFLAEVQKALPSMTEEQAGKLLSSPAFQTILKGQFMSNWTISPEHMKDPGAMDDLYQKMAHQMEVLSKFSGQNFGRELFPQVSDTAQDMQNNMDFMRTLNETFQYIQLPLKLQNQNAHGDLYVMTRKESIKKDPRHLKVLLHLELDALGTLDIQISRENTAVSTHFFVTKKSTKELLERNMELLSDAINKQGYAFHSEMSMKEKEMDIVKDFIGAEAPVGDFKRYNFDLRA